MWFSSWLRKQTVSRKQRPASRFRPTFEVLEERAVPATFTVNTTLDVLRSSRSDTTLSLRQAIIDANATKTADTIVLPAATTPYKLSRAGVGEDNCLTGDLDIKAPLTIRGAGSASTIIDGAGLDRVFHLHSYAATFSGMTIQGGKTSASGGGIYSPSLGGVLTVSNCVVSGNTASAGGGIHTGAPLTVTDSTFSGNTVTNYGGGIHAGVMTVRGSTFSDNTAYNGGGIYATGTGVMTVEYCTLSHNHADYGGGGLKYNGSNYYPGTVRNCTIADNTAAYVGGGIHIIGGILTVQACTLTGNSAFQGGAVYASHTLTIDTCTLSENTASQGGGIYTDSNVTVLNSVIVRNSATDSGGGIYRASGTLRLNGSTVLDNSAPLGADLYGVSNSSIDSGSTIGVMFP